MFGRPIFLLAGVVVIELGAPAPLLLNSKDFRTALAGSRFYFGSLGHSVAFGRARVEYFDHDVSLSAIAHIEDRGGHAVCRAFHQDFDKLLYAFAVPDDLSR